MLWQPGLFKPVENKWSWHKLTNVVWVDQPVGSGFSQGTVTARNEEDVAKQFLSFWKNFVDTFAMQGYKVYVTGSSYSGLYSPYIASAMIDANDETYYNVAGMQIFDGTFSDSPLAEDVPVAAFVENWKQIFAFNNSFSQQVQDAADTCGYTEYLRKYLSFPPVGKQPSTLPGQQQDGGYKPGCNLFETVFFAANDVNPCFSVYSIVNQCPIAYDPLGFSDGTFFNPEGAGPVYFNRQDVKAAIHAPLDKEWEFCASEPVFVNGVDESVKAGPGSQPVIPRVIDATKNVIIGHGALDFVLIADGTLLAIQNMTWGGELGFQQRPGSPLYVPYHSNDIVPEMAGAGIVGTVHTERGLTYFAVAKSGHFVSMDAPALAFRSLEVLLGRVPSFESTVPFTTDLNATPQPQAALGNGTVMQGFDALAESNGAQTVVKTTSGAGGTLRASVVIIASMFIPAIFLAVS